MKGPDAMTRNILSSGEFNSEKLATDGAHARGILSTSEYLAWLSSWSQDPNGNWINEEAV